MDSFVVPTATATASLICLVLCGPRIEAELHGDESDQQNETNRIR